MPTARPIIIVTGANSGVGFGICQRLLVQLSQKVPPDALVDLSPVPEGAGADAEVESYDGLTLIMACRNQKLGEAARTQLLSQLDAHVAQLRKSPGYDGHADEFQKNLIIDLQYIDLANVGTVYEFAGVCTKYPYISHLICNAGVASFDRIDWPVFFKAFFTSPADCFTRPTYHLQNVGEVSVDQLGWVWQCNVFGHYLLTRLLFPRFSQSPVGARVVWMSSIEALAQHARIDDLQLIKTRHSYQASKYQIDVLAPLLDERTNHVVRQFVVEPGISVTNISKKLTGTVALLIFFQYLAMYLARFLGSKAHTIQPYIAANSAVKLSLVPLSRIKTVPEKPVKYSSTTNIWGKEQLGITPMETPSKDFGGYLLNECDSLHRTFGSETRVKQYRKDDGI